MQEILAHSVLGEMPPITPIAYKKYQQYEKENPGCDLASRLNVALEQYRCHQLTDLVSAKLMDRVDTKFLLPVSILPDLLTTLSEHYSALSVRGNFTSTYRNIYFDTPEMSFYNAHHNGKLNRYKVRQRCYMDSDTRFLEVKFKNNKRRTLKSRVETSNAESTPESPMQFIREHLGMELSALQVSQYSGYKRIALACNEKGERLTLDFDLWYLSCSGGPVVNLPNVFVAELKQQSMNFASPFFSCISSMGYRPLSFSKYCVGCALLYRDQLKTNRFKPALMTLEKMH